MIPNEQALVRENKRLLGPIVALDCSEVDTASAHRILGQDARAQIHKFLARRMDDLGSREKVEEQIRQARRVQAALQARVQTPGLSETIKEAVRQYQACLASWVEGAELAGFRHTLLAKRVDGMPVCADDLAILLQEDEVGCQTGVFREHNGSVILWHSEEDYETSAGQRFDKLRLFFFRAANDQKACGFIYPDLLPGPTFAWQAGDFVQAVDSLHVRPLATEDGIPPNTLAWISLYLGARVSRKELAMQLGPFQGGYSLTAVYKEDGQVRVEKVEFANSQSVICELENKPGSHLFQTNIIRDLSQPIGAEELTSTESRHWNETRLARTGRFLKVIQASNNEALPLVFRMLRSRLGGESAYANRDVKAYLVCRMSTEKTSIRVGAGAALAGDELFSLDV
jgi:hypothetical protein